VVFCFKTCVLHIGALIISIKLSFCVGPYDGCKNLCSWSTSCFHHSMQYLYRFDSFIKNESSKILKTDNVRIVVDWVTYHLPWICQWYETFWQNPKCYLSFEGFDVQRYMFMAILTRLTQGVECSIHSCMCMTGEGRAKFSLSNYLEEDHIVIMIVQCSIGVVFAWFYTCGHVYILLHVSKTAGKHGLL
jgi:hypothetical protein